MNPKTALILTKEDKGKSVYKIVCKHELVLEQEILANSADEAFDLYIKEGGLNYSAITSDLTCTSPVIETTMIDAESPDTKVTYLGTVVENSDDCMYDLELKELDPGKMYSRYSELNPVSK